jgi:hypothetical protein
MPHTRFLPDSCVKVHAVLPNLFKVMALFSL